MNWSLRRRLTAAAVVSAALLVTVIGVAGLTETWRRSNIEREQDLEFVPDRIGIELTGEEINTGMLASTTDEFVALFDADGALIAASANIDRALVESFAKNELEVATLSESDIYFGSLDANGHWEVAAVSCTDQTRCGSIVVGRRRVPWSSFIWRRLPWGLGLLGMVCILVGLGANWLVSRSLRPVERMRRELDEITGADTRRIDVPPTGDELASLATSMNSTVDRLAAAIAAQRQFVSDSAHELRSPLAGLRATLELADADPSRAARAIPEAITQVDRTTALIDDLLELARSDAGFGAPLRLTDIDDLLRNELRDLTLRRPEVRIDRRKIDPVQVLADSGGISRMIRNLLDNAAAHCETTVSVGLGADADSWTLTVDDDGGGIPVDEREVVFERFRRLDESRSRHTGGTGLGLAIVAGIVRAHRGTVRVEESNLGGARFVVTVWR
jgi:signal transduction histidine kinase